MQAEGLGSEFAKVYHVPGMRKQLFNVQEELDNILGAFGAIEERFELMSKFKLNQTELAAYLGKVFPVPKKRTGQSEHSFRRATEQIEDMRQRAAELSGRGKGNQEPAIRNTLWTAYNGVVELVDHQLLYSDPWQRLDSLCFGKGMHTKELAYHEACQMLIA